jgi:hypothetical protein
MTPNTLKSTTAKCSSKTKSANATYNALMHYFHGANPCQGRSPKAIV